MATYKQLMVLADDQNFQNRVKIAMQSAAIDVMAESTATTAHITRKTYAGKILDGTASVYQFTVGVLVNGTISGEVTAGSSDSAVPDSDVQFVVNSEFNAFAGV